jgi:hypothetical protein
MPYKDPEKQKAAQKQHYEDNRGKYAEASYAARQRRKMKIRELKKDPCVDCEVNYPHYVMQFDHINSDKVGDIGTMISNYSWQTVLDEIAKCELVCANCHAARTYLRAQRRPVV